MIKGLENLPFEGAVLHMAVGAINTIAKLLAGLLGESVEITIEIERDHLGLLTVGVTWVKNGIKYSEQRCMDVMHARDSVARFVSTLDHLVWGCMQRNSNGS